MDRLKGFFTSGSNTSQIVIVLVIGSVLFGVIYGIMTKIMNNMKNKRNNPLLIKGVHDGSKPLHFTQDLKESNAVPILRSKNEDDGMEFTYSYWFVVNDMNYKFGEWKHLFHKGNKTSWPNRAPGVWLHPEKNSLRVYMNVYEDVIDYIDIENIPINKWVHMAVVLRNTFLDIYINGDLVKRHELKGIAKQNFNDLYICNFGGFSGYLSRFKYNNHALEPKEIRSLSKNIPSISELDTTPKEGPPYLSYRWDETQ